MEKIKYIIGSGWWCSDISDIRDVFYGDDEIRGKDFHELWKLSIDRFTNPEQIIIVDSNSPIKPSIRDDITFISLNENAGHSTNHRGKFSGWMRSVLVSASYASSCDCDYYVYVEQDVLLYGNNIIERCIKEMKSSYAFGKCNDHSNSLQQSFFIIKKDKLDTFLSNLYNIKYTDFSLPPERKFSLATSPLFKFIPKVIFVSPKNELLKKILRRPQNMLSKIVGSYDFFSIGYGRDRPINFESSCFYFQHGSAEEIEMYVDKVNG